MRRCSCTSGSRPPRGVPLKGMRRGRIEESREKGQLQIEEGKAKERGVQISRELKVNGLRGFERSTFSRDTILLAGFWAVLELGLSQPRSSAIMLERVGAGRRSWFLRSDRQRDAREVRPRQGPRRGQTERRAKDSVGALGVKVADDEELRGRAGRDGVLIDDVEKQRLDEARAPCLNQRCQTQAGTRHARRGLAKHQASSSELHPWKPRPTNRLTEYLLSKLNKGFVFLIKMLTKYIKINCVLAF